MKIKAAIAGALIVVMSIVFVACGGAKDGEITTTKAPATSATKTTNPSTTRGTVMEELSSAANDASEGLSDAASEIGSGVKGMFD